MYKLNFPLEEYKKINSILSEVTESYFWHEGAIYGKSLMPTGLYMAFTDKMNDINMEHFMIPPNYMASALKDCKKTKTIIHHEGNHFEIFQAEDKIKDEVLDCPKQPVISIPRTVITNDEDAIARMMRETIMKFGPYMKIVRKVLIGDDECLSSVPPIDVQNAALSNTSITLIHPMYPNDPVVITKQAIPAYKRAEGIKFAIEPIDDHYANVFIVVSYDACNVLCIYKIIRGI